MKNLTTEIVNLLFNYNKETGGITHKEKDRIMFKSDQGWKISNSRVGSDATTINSKGTLLVSINQKQYTASRIIGLIAGLDMNKIGAVKFKDEDKTNLIYNNLIFKQKGAIVAKDANCWCEKTKSIQGSLRIDFYGSFYVNSSYESDAVMTRIKNAINTQS